MKSIINPKLQQTIMKITFYCLFLALVIYGLFTMYGNLNRVFNEFEGYAIVRVTAVTDSKATVQGYEKTDYQRKNSLMMQLKHDPSLPLRKHKKDGTLVIIEIKADSITGYQIK